MRCLPLLLLTLCLSGCSSLILRDDDSALTTTGKVATRTVLGIGTLGFSELFVADAVTRERQAAIGRA